MDFITASTSESLVASAGASTSGNIVDLLAIIGAAVAVPLVFYIAHRIMGLFPGRRGR